MSGCFQKPSPKVSWVIIRLGAEPELHRFGWRKTFPGHTNRNWGILGIIRDAAGHPLIKWLPRAPSSPLHIGVNCKQKLLLVWSAVVMILSLPPASPPPPVLLRSLTVSTCGRDKQVWTSVERCGSSCTFPEKSNQISVRTSTYSLF